MCNYCDGNGIININPSDNAFGWFSQMLNTAYCPYCTKGRELREATERAGGEPKSQVQILSYQESLRALGIHYEGR